MSPRDEIENRLATTATGLDAEAEEAARRFAERAAAEGAAKIAYATIDTPVGSARRAWPRWWSIALLRAIVITQARGWAPSRLS
jgi:hypothetical protein